MQYSIKYNDPGGSRSKVVWSKGEPYTNDDGEVMLANAAFMVTEDATPPTNLCAYSWWVRGQPRQLQV